MIRTWLASLVGVLGSGLALATTATLQDFAYGLRVEAAGTGPIWELTLPEAIAREAPPAVSLGSTLGLNPVTGPAN